MFPERFNNKTNGVTPRRWLLLANPALAGASPRPSATAGSPTSPSCERLEPLADDAGFRDAVRKAKREAKARFADWLKSTSGSDGRPGHDLRLPGQAHPRVQAAAAERAAHRRALQPAAGEPGPRDGAAHLLLRRQGGARLPLAKLIIKFINNLAGTIDGDPAVRGRLKVVFLPEYCVSLAERLIPASDVSNQISTAGYEASGTSNMKFMMNGALTIGTRDGATIEMAEEAGEENFFLFGLTRRAGRGQPRLVQPAVALRERAGDPRGARPDLLRPLQPQRAGRLRAAARHAADPRRPLHAPGGPRLLPRGGPAAAASSTPNRTHGRARRS